MDQDKVSVFNEGIIYMANFAEAWLANPEALVWLKSRTETHRSGRKTSRVVKRHRYGLPQNLSGLALCRNQFNPGVVAVQRR